MKRIAAFEKVSAERFLNDSVDICPVLELAKDAYEIIKLPKRATKGSAGYDFYAPFDFTLKPGETIKIPTGIRCKMEEGWVLKIYPRSGLGFKYRLQLNNTVGIIDSDYYYSDNEGHIMIKITTATKIKLLKCKKVRDSLRAYLLNLALHAMMTQLTKETEVSAAQLQIKEGIA